jgi:hypothetical protein
MPANTPITQVMKRDCLDWRRMRSSIEATL